MKKNSVLKTSFAGLLAVSLLMGGASYAYLQSSTEEVVNNFNTHNVKVGLIERTRPNFDIIPGTTQRKDPVVTVDSSIPAYVFVKVNDNTAGLVNFERAAGWNVLEGTADTVWYREYDPRKDEENSFEVLLNNEVSYDADKTNADMLNEDGTLKADLTLSFQAFAIQMAPFTSPLEAYLTANGINTENMIVVTNDAELNAALNSVEEDNVTVLVKSKEDEYHLNGSVIRGNNLTVIGEGNVVINVGTSGAIGVGQSSIYVFGNNAQFKDLTLTNEAASTFQLFKAHEANSVVLSNVNIVANNNETAVNFHNSTAEINNCNITTYCVSLVPTVAATGSVVRVNNTRTVNIGNVFTPQYGFNWANNNPDYSKEKFGRLYLNNCTGNSDNVEGITVNSSRLIKAGDKNADEVYLNGSETPLTKATAGKGVSIVYTPVTGTIYTITY